MANNTTNFTLRLRTQGLDEAQKQTQVIRDNLEAAARAAAQVGGATPGAATPGGSASSRRVAASRAASPTGAAGASAGIEGGDVEMYNRARGASAAAGGTARDFADMSRGLGGFVRLYATLAANLYAAGAAFNFLSNAMDAANMVRGMDQLGAASGRALGTLSQELVRATGGAISLREAMEATQKATSAGLSSKQVLELGNAATKASQALGLNLSDAVSRLSRGISKLEPELLDELGIYVKIEDAVDKYARTLGKTASSLTDYERRQAFATEALSQANKKFGEIQIDTNPYTKLLATLKDLGQTVGNVLNTVISPLVRFLSESPTALALAIGFLATKVIKQAIPAFGEYRAGLKAALDDTKNKAAAIMREQAELAKARDIAGSTGAITRLRQDPAMAARLEDLKQQAELLSKTGKTDYAKIADVDPFGMTDADLAAWEKKLERRAKVLERTNDREADVIRAHILDVKRIRAEGEAAAEAAQEAIERRDNKFYSQMAMTRAVASRAMRQANRADILNEVDKVQQLEGASAAWKKLNEELGAPSRKIKLIDPNTGEEIEETIERGKGLFGFFERNITRLRGGFGIAFQTITSFASAWGPIISTGIGIATAVFEVLDGWLSKNKKQLEEFNASLEASGKSVKLVADTLERINKQPLGDALTPQNIEARANSFVELSNSVEKSGNAFSELNKASSGWDKAIDWTKELFNLGSTSDISKSLSSQITSALNAVDIRDRDALESQLKSLLNVSNLDTSSITKALKSAGKEGAESIALNISKAIKDAANKAAADAAKLKEALAIFENINKSYQDLANSLKDSSPLASFASGLVQETIKGQKALDNLSTSVSYFIEILKDPNKLKIFDENSIKVLKDSEKELLRIAQGTQQLEKDIRDGEAAMAALGQKVVEVYDEFTDTKVVIQLDDAELQEKIAKGYKAKAQLDIDAEKIRDRLKGLLEGPIAKGVSIATAEFERSMRKVSLDVTGNLISRLSGIGKAEAEFAIQKERIQIEIESITAMYELVRAVEKNSLTIKERDLRDKLEKRGEALGFNKEVDLLEAVKTDDKEFQRLQKSLKEITGGFDFLNKGVRVTKKDFDELSKKAPDIATGLFSFFQQSMGLRSKVAGQQGQLQIAQIARDFGIEEEKFQNAQKLKKEELERLNITKDRAALVSQIVGTDSIALLQLKQQTAETASLKEEEIAREEIINRQNTARLVAQKLIKLSDKKQLTEEESAALKLANESLKEAERELKVFDEQVKAKKELRTINNQIEEERAKAASAEKEFQFNREINSQLAERRKLELDFEQEKLDRLVKFGVISKTEETNRVAALRAQTQELEYQNQLRALREDTEQKRRGVELTRTTGLIAAGEDPTRRKAVEEAAAVDLERINALEIVREETLARQNQQKLLSIELNRQEAESLGRVADIFQRIAQSLSGLGETGKGIAEGLQGAATAIAQFALNREALDKDYSKKSTEIEKDRAFQIAAINSERELDETERAREILKVNENAAKKTTDLTKSKVKTEKALEMDRDIAVIGSAKKLFKEKTAAYRVLATLEKAMHIARLIMDAKEIASTVAKTAINIVESGKRAFAAGQEAIAAAFAAKPWPLGLVAGGAMIAIMAGLLGKAFGGGGGGAAAPSGFGMEEQRQTEGTGKSWVNGELVDTGGGKPGGGDGRASSLEKGLDLVAKYTFEGLNYSNGMLKALLQIEQNTRGAAYAVFRSMNPNDKSTFVGGIQTGQLRPNYLRTGAANTLGAAAGVAGGAVLGSAIAFAGSSFAAGGLLGSVAGKVAGFLGGALSTGMAIALPVIGLLLAKPLGKLFGKIFGGKVTQSIEDSGIVIEGTLNSIIDGTKGVVEEYANLKTVKDRGIFRKKGVSFSTVEQEAQDDVKRYFAGIFSGMRGTLKEAGKLLGKDVSAFLDTYVVKDFKVSSKGRTAEEFADALRGEVSEAFNKMAKAAFPELEKFADAGEEFGETVIRMAKQISVFDTAMKMIGRGGLSSTNLRSILSNVNVTATSTRQVSTGTTSGTRQVEFDQEVTQQEYDDISAGFVLVNRFVRSISTVPVAIEQFTTVTETSVRRLTATEINDVVLNITDTLIDLAGGMEQFLERAQAIRENFLTDAQKVGQIAAEIRPILDSLGVGSIRSKADFLTILDDAQDNLVVAAANLKAAELTADTADDAPAQQAFDFAAALVTTLMELAPGIAQVLDYETKLAAAREDQAMTIANLLGDEKLITAARDAQRARQLADMDVALRPGQQYIWALEDEKRIKDELIRLQDEQIKKLEQTKSTVSNLIKTLSDFKSQLLGGSQTILTPQQVYQQKKAEYDALVTAASSSDETIRNAALAKLPQVASSFLDASRTMFASGTAYAADFNSVIQTLDAQGAELLSQEEYLAKQLSELQTASDQLKGINTNTQDTATRIAELEQALVTAQSATAIASAMWTSSSGEPIANFLTSTSNGANVVAAINNASANTATQNSQLAQATVGSIVQLGIDVDASLEKWLKEYGWRNPATATYDNSIGP